MTILSKKEMSEEDIKFQYITPAILAKWDMNRISMETKITDGKINLHGNIVHRDKESAKSADYVLYWNKSFPIAIVEAKKNKHSVSFGLQQAITYAQMISCISEPQFSQIGFSSLCSTSSTGNLLIQSS